MGVERPSKAKGFHIVFFLAGALRRIASVSRPLKPFQTKAGRLL
jgi:hypothetical protein